MRGWYGRVGLTSLACLALVAGCGYQFRLGGPGPTIGNSKEAVSPDLQPRLAIRTLVNNSFEPNLETRYTNYLREEFASGSGTRVVGNAEAADLLLTGQILSVSVPTLSFTQTSTQESRAEVVVLVRVEETSTKKVLWTQAARGTSEFFVTPDLQFNRALQNRALEQAGRFVAADLAARFLLLFESGGLSRRAAAVPPAGP
jgi:hypothetical protein